MTSFHITAEKDVLLGALQSAARVATKGNHLPILQNVLLTVEERKLTVTGTDLETQIIATTWVHTEAPGSLTVNAGKLLNLVKLSPDNTQFTLQADGEHLHVRYGRSRYKLQTLPAENFPVFDADDRTHELQLRGDTLQAALNRVAFALAQNDVRHYLNGLAISLNGAQLHTIASDGHRLARQLTQLDEDAGQSPISIIPRNAVKNISDLIAAYLKAAPNAVVTLALGQRSVSVTVGQLQLSAKLIEGVYPDENRVIPRDLPTRLVVDRQELLGSMDRVMLLASDKQRAVRIGITETDLTLEATNAENELGTDALDGIFLSGPPIELGFNGTYLADALRTVEAPNATIDLSSGAALLTDDNHPGWLAVVMPMRL